ncbi:hypothetical protein LY28_02848 [Ruminiclostridium sufflavum DSM 19573]|uniref:Uncharacterized protein n=1 Tax=Ruminiclostridium sufflavum DSM 19573 TaxID=1121337 RepID=A0A318XLT1_9FIRM|nr:hypothetical protein [Ruminiclostridium sufflavum]PYG86629.1 hypothetical protein LY28_02848 [Ruminiclostridium sufflavum DSM 19573]
MTNLNANFSELTYRESIKVEGGFAINPALGPLIMVIPALYPEIFFPGAAVIGAKLAVGQY